MKYAVQIAEAFKRLGFSPRENQTEAINAILVAFLDDNFKNVCVNAPTGTGKSVIGAVTAEALSSITDKHADGVKSSISLTATNALATQYGKTFHILEESEKYMMIKGANNYPCGVMNELDEEANLHNAEECNFRQYKETGAFPDLVFNHCNSCEYMNTKRRRNAVRHLTTNYSFYFVDRMYSGIFEDRDLIVFDEAHLLNDLFSEHNAIFTSVQRLDTLTTEYNEGFGLSDVGIIKKIRSVRDALMSPNVIDASNYKEYLRVLMDIYAFGVTNFKEAQLKAMRTRDLKRSSKMQKMISKYEGLSCKIDDLFNFEYEHVYDFNEKDKSLSVKPVFIKEMFLALECGPRNLFMSATITEADMIETLGMTTENLKFIKLAPTFPAENKEFIFYKPMALNYTSTQDPKVLDSLRKNALDIVKKHVSLQERGIILTPSFRLQEEIMKGIRPLEAAGKLKIFEQVSGTPLAKVLEDFRCYTGGPAVLVSPSMYEGIDLSGDLCRFQILVKAPWPSLGDKRMAYIKDHHPSQYRGITLKKLVQGAGRGVRSADDHAVTYCLDATAQNIFKSKNNIWLDEFKLSFKTFLD